MLSCFSFSCENNFDLFSSLINKSNYLFKVCKILFEDALANIFTLHDVWHQWNSNSSCCSKNVEIECCFIRIATLNIQWNAIIQKH